MPNELTDVHVEKIDLVGLAANQRKVTLFKSVEQEPTTEVRPLTNQEILEAIKDLRDEDRDEVLKALTPEPKPDPIETAPEEVKKAVAEKDERIQKAEDRVADLEKKIAEREAADRRAVALERVGVLKGMGFTDEDAEHFETLPDAVYDKLVAFEKQAATADLFKEVGKTGKGDSGYEAKLASAVAEIKKSKPDINDADAEVEALERNPKLYEEYLSEHSDQVQ